MMGPDIEVMICTGWRDVGVRPMRGRDARSDALFSYVSCEARVPKDHPLRLIRQIVDEALAALSPEFGQLYAKFGRPSIPPERLLRALLLRPFTRCVRRRS